MKVLKVLLSLTLIFSLASCSNSGKKADSQSDSEAVASGSGEDADFIVDADDEELVAEDKTEEAAPVVDEPEIVASAAEPAPQIEISGDVGEYTVKKGDTLMLIAFNLYGDYRKWKSIRNLNNLSNVDVSEGTVLKYNVPKEKFIWNPEGMPYLIKVGDSLVSISKDKYKTTKKWKHLYQHNQPLIQDPNLIFAGFTLYYIPDREIASE